MLIGAPAAIGELHRVGLAQVDHAGSHQLVHERRRVRRSAVPPGSRAAHRDLAFDLDQVFDRDRNAVQRADRMTGADCLVRAFGGQARTGGVDGDECVQLGVQSLDACEIFVHQVDRRQAARGNLRGQLMDGTKGRGHGTLPANGCADHAVRRQPGTGRRAAG
jgi:hypothetical protein